ncbi:MAG: pyridoxamine 5-phosphate oxidase [Tabrizicola sp.]|nr:pyridoxamine 5-phosphate oxidase [Tabrizicola sp.]
MAQRPDPVAPADDAARAQARALLALPHAALAFRDPEEGSPGISRIAFGLGHDGQMLTLISALAVHHAALRADPACALLLGEPGPKGDPLIHPRLMIRATAGFVTDPDDRSSLRAAWLTTHPKARLYIDFADFAFVRFTPVSLLLNGGFGKAFRLMPGDLSQ